MHIYLSIVCLHLNDQSMCRKAIIDHFQQTLPLADFVFRSIKT